jgi:hypothetical protein
MPKNLLSLVVSKAPMESRRLRHPGQLGGLALCLALAGLSCLLAAYRLSRAFSEHYQLAYLSSPALQAPFSPIYLNTSSRLPSLYHKVADPDARFLSYLPHSGLHNQRIALENALVLAALLNRTLVVPPARLGSAPLHYAPPQVLRRLLVLSGKDGLLHCAPALATIADFHGIKSGYTPPECADAQRFTHVAWDTLVDFSAFGSSFMLAASAVSDTLYPWLDGSPPAPFHIHSTYALADAERALYDFRFVDFRPRRSHISKYTHAVPLSFLASITSRHLALGSLFGSSRLALRDPAHKNVRRQVRAHMLLTSHPVLRAAADQAARALGGTYVAAHVRVGDGAFKWHARENVRRIWYALVMAALDASLEDAHALERRLLGDVHGPPPDMEEDQAARRTPHPSLATLPNVSMPQLACSRVLHTDPRLPRLNTPLFISTDARDPRKNYLFKSLLETFPCTFFLGDLGPFYVSPKALDISSDALHFDDALSDNHVSASASNRNASAFTSEEPVALARLHNTADAVPLAPFLAPLLEAAIAAHAVRVAGTPGSTFSAYVCDVLWRADRGFDVVVRG